MDHLNPGDAAQRRSAVSMVRLIDRRSGLPLRRDGRPLTLFTRDPAQAVRALMADRDPAIWNAVVRPLPGTEGTA